MSSSPLPPPLRTTTSMVLAKATVMVTVMAMVMVTVLVTVMAMAAGTFRGDHRGLPGHGARQCRRNGESKRT
jgi:hypothetical protein